jgi:hypothetical protein
LSGTTPAQIVATANSNALAGGTYTGQIVVSGPNNTLTVPVQVSVSASNIFMFSLSAVTFSLKAGSGIPPTQTAFVYGRAQARPFRRPPTLEQTG